jgi:hypothetical protein
MGCNLGKNCQVISVFHSSVVLSIACYLTPLCCSLSQLPSPLPAPLSAAVGRPDPAAAFVVYLNVPFFVNF